MCRGTAMRFPFLYTKAYGLFCTERRMERIVITKVTISHKNATGNKL